MELATPSHWRAEFTRKAALSRELQLRIAAEHRELCEKSDREAEEDRREEALADFVQAVAFATETEIAAFTVQLDSYDAATVDALLLNQEQLDRVRAGIDAMLLRAHVLPDGRRVFETEDGQRVFDERGLELGHHEITPEEIDDALPRWETFSGAWAEETQLVAERAELLEYQVQLDQSRERLDETGLSGDELADLGAELDTVMPAAVRDALQRGEGAQSARLEPAGPSDTVQPLDLEALSRSLMAADPQPR